MKMEASVDPQCRGPDWMPITPKTGSLFHAETQGILVVILELVRMKMVRFHFDDVFSQRKHVVRDLDVRDVCEDVLRSD
jgi:hypothetical protein